MDIIIGTHGTANIEQKQRVVDMADSIALLQPSAAPLTVLLMRLQKREAFNPKFEWLEDDLTAKWDAAVGAYIAKDTAITVNYTYFSVNDIVKVPSTGECMKVTSVAYGIANVITVIRGYGTTDADAIADKALLVIIGNANQEGASSPTIMTSKVVPQFNYTQIFRKPFGVTNTEDASELYGGPDLAYQRKKMGIEHSVDIERAFLFGEANEDLSGAQPTRTTAGVLSYVKTNVASSVGTLDETKFETFLRGLFQYGSDVKFLFCSPILLSAISTLAVKNTLRTLPKEQTFGLNITRYVSPHGEVNLIKHRLLENAYDGYGIALDLKNLWYRPLRKRDTILKTNIQNNDEDQEKDEYITECGLQLNLEKTHGVMTGVTGA